MLIACVYAMPTNHELVTEIDERNPDNSYFFLWVLTPKLFSFVINKSNYPSYETNDGQLREETGEFEEENGIKTFRVHGRFSYRGPDGVFYEVKYVSDKDGFRPKGDHLPGVAAIKSALPSMKPSIKRIQPSLIASLTG